MFSTLCLRSRLLYSLQYCWKIEPFLFSSNIAATFSKSFKRVFTRNEKFLVQYCCQYCTRILLTYLHDQKYCCNIATRNRAQESCSCKAGLRHNVVLPGLLNGKSERLPLVGSEDKPSPITNSCKSNSSHGYCRARQRCVGLLALINCPQT